MTIDRLDLYKNVIERYVSEYDELLDNWRDLERKSQGAIAVSGILLAGVFGIVTKSFDAIKDYHILFIAIALLALTGSIVYSVFVLSTKRVLNPPTGEKLEQITREMLEALNTASENEIEKRLLGLAGDQCASWKKANKDIRDKNEAKANHLYMAQWFTVLALAALIVEILLILK